MRSTADPSGERTTFSLERFRRMHSRSRRPEGGAQGAAYTQAVRRRPGPVVRMARARRSARSPSRPAAPSPSPPRASSTRRIPASVRDGSNRIVTVEAPPRLVLVVSDGPERLLARLGVHAAVAPDGRHGRARAGRPSRSRRRRAGLHARPRSSATTRFIRQLDVPVFVMPGGRLAGHRARRGRARRAHEPRRGRAARSRSSLRKQREQLAKRARRRAAAVGLRRRGLRHQHPAHDAARAPDHARRREARRARPTASRPSTRSAPPARPRRLHRDQHERRHARAAALQARPEHAARRSPPAASSSSTRRPRAPTSSAYSLMRSLAHSLHPAVVKQ